MQNVILQSLFRVSQTAPHPPPPPPPHGSPATINSCPGSRQLGSAPGSGGRSGSPEQEAVGEIEETHLTPGTAHFGGVAQQDSAEVGIHGFGECLEVSVQERPGAGDKAVRAQLPAGGHAGRSLPTPQGPGAPVPRWQRGPLGDELKQDDVMITIAVDTDGRDYPRC